MCNHSQLDRSETGKALRYELPVLRCEILVGHEEIDQALNEPDDGRDEGPEEEKVDHSEALRHTHAAWLIAAGEHPKTIQQRMGHGSITVTLDTYGHLMEGLDDGAADKLEEMFKASASR